ncbi:MAG: sulfate adenylyltransferase subunit 2 [Methanolobus sp.]|jgi:hypothetical protein|nr:sulfate adenylyltransferase subunit 2 [Methanolobus sp.]
MSLNIEETNHVRNMSVAEESYRLSNLKTLEAESISIIREVAAEFEKPVMLYSVGKDSSVMAHLAIKAFYPKKVPFPLLHIDTGYKFPEMYEFRDHYTAKHNLELRVHRNEEALKRGINPLSVGTVKCCAELKTKALLDALKAGGYDACVLAGKPLSHGSIFRFEGQVTTILPGKGPCYRCLFEHAPPAGMVPGCQETGVIGVLPGIIGVIQATEVIKYLLGLGDMLSGRLIFYDALSMSFDEIKVRKDPSCPVCGESPAIVSIEAGNYQDDEGVCSIG